MKKEPRTKYRPLSHPNEVLVIFEFSDYIVNPIDHTT